MKRPDGGNPGRAIDLFGVGKDGFKDDPGDPPATQLDAAIFNNLVESLCEMVESSGLVLDGLNFNQITEALNIWKTFSAIAIANGGTFTLEDASTLIVEADGGNGGSKINVAGLVDVLSAGTLRAVIGSIVNLLGDVTVGTTAGQTFTSNGLAQLNENVTVAAAKTLTLTDDASLVGGADSQVDVDKVTTLDLEFDDAGTSIPTTNLNVRWNTTSPLARSADGTVRSWPIPSHGFDTAFSTAGAISDTTAIATIRIQETELVRTRVVFDYEHDTGAIGTLNTRIEVSGTPGTVDIVTRSHLLPASGGVRWRSKTLDFFWRPDDDFVTPGTQDYQFLVRIGSSLGATLSARNVTIEVISSISV